MLRYAKCLLYQQQSIIKHTACCISLSSQRDSKSSIKLTEKFILQNAKKKRKWHDHNFTITPSGPGHSEGKVAKPSPRYKNLSKVFLDRISDIMSMGDVSAELFFLGFELSEVRILPNVQGINVYWICTGTSADKQIEAILEKYSGPLRHELSQLRILGHIPPITFVKDQRYQKLMEVEQLLSIADFGEDFEPSDKTHDIKSSVLKMTLDSDVKEAISNLQDKKAEDPFEEAFKMTASGQPVFTDPDDVVLPPDIPTMRHDVLGVDTKRIYVKIQHGIKRARADHRRGVGLLPDEPLQLTSDEPEMLGPMNIRQWAIKYKQLRNQKAKSRRMDEDLLQVPQTESNENDDDYECTEEDDFIEEMDFATSESQLR